VGGLDYLLEIGSGSLQPLAADAGPDLASTQRSPYFWNTSMVSSTALGQKPQDFGTTHTFALAEIRKSRIQRGTVVFVDFELLHLMTVFACFSAYMPETKIVLLTSGTQ